MKLALLAAAWLAGIFLGSRVDAGLLRIVLLLLAALPAAILLRLLGRSLWPVLLAVVLLAGLLRTEAFQVTEVPLAVQETETVTLRGRIDNDPEATPGLLNSSSRSRRLTGRRKLVVRIPRPWCMPARLHP